MNVCMYVCVYILCMSVHLCIHTCICMCTHIHKYVHTYMTRCLLIKPMYLCMCMYVVRCDLLLVLVTITRKIRVPV